MDTNVHVKAISPADLEEANKLILRLLEILFPYATPLTAQDRKELPIMGEKSLSFVEKSFEYAKGNPDLRPNLLNLDDYSIDVADAVGLRVLKNNLHQAYEIVDDIVTLAGSEAYQSSLVFYAYVKFLAANDTPGAKTVYNELKTRFPGRGRSKNEENIEEN
jgi:hypothetical protein